MLKIKKVSGLFSATVAPFNPDGTLNRPLLSKHIKYLISNGIAGLVPNGGTGEFSALTVAERVQIIETTLEASEERVPIIAGIASPGLMDSIEIGKQCLTAGAHGLMVITPFGTAPTQDGIRDYYKRISDGVGQPVMLYEIPYLTGTFVHPETVARIADDGSIFSMKASNPDMVRFVQLIRSVGDKIQILSGDEDLFALEIASGAVGGVLATTNILPRIWLEIFKHAQTGNLEEAQKKQARLADFLSAVYSEPNPGPMKAALAIAGFDVGAVRAPNRTPGSDLKSRLQELLTPLLAYEKSLSVEAPSSFLWR